MLTLSCKSAYLLSVSVARENGPRVREHGLLKPAAWAVVTGPASDPGSYPVEQSTG